ncbi:MAG: hypothetical protein QW626_00900 [Candidatus Hadarchaeales archaeon]
MLKVSVRGFLPLTATGVILLILSSNLAAYLLWRNHERKMQTMMQKEFDDLDWRISFLCSSMKDILRWSAERALIEASQRAEQYHPNVEEVAGIIASGYFAQHLQAVIDSFQNSGEKINLFISTPVVRFSSTGDFIIARAYFPLGLLVEIKNPEGTIIASKKIWKIETPIKVRFFLLENLMDNFIREHQAKVIETLEKMLYFRAWSEALINGIVHLDRSSDEVLFRYAWCKAEEEIFRSADWLDISELDFFTEKIELISSEINSLRELKSAFLQIYEILYSSHQKVEKTIDGELNLLELVEKDLENAIKLLQNVLSHKEPGKISSRIIQGMCKRPENDAPSIAEQLEIGISKIIAEIKTAQRMLNQRETKEAENILQSLFSTVKPKEIRIEHEIAGEKIRGIFKIYFDENSPPSIMAVLELLSGILSDLAKISSPEPEFEFHISQLDIPEMSRETLYKTFPPRSECSPFVSVYHDLKIKSVEYFREDLSGVIGNRTATPIYLPFLDVVIWWGQWSVVIKIGDGVEEIFDYPNQNLLQKTLLGYIHSCLSYRWSFKEENFIIRVVVISPEPFYFSEI